MKPTTAAFTLALLACAGLTRPAHADHATAGRAEVLAQAEETGENMPALNREETMRLIEDARFADRERVTETVQSEADQAPAIIAEIQRAAERLENDAKTEIKGSIEKVRDAQVDLQIVVAQARRSPPDRWNDVRDELANRYEAYAVATAEALRTAREHGAALPEGSASTSAG